MKSRKAKAIKNKNIIIIVVLLIIVILSVLIYKNLFSNSNNNRFSQDSNYKVSNDEIKSAKDKLNELGNIDSIDIYTNSKIIRIFVKLSDDVEFERLKNISNETLNSFTEDNLSYYDVEIFVESSNDNSEIYPKIGYKHKSNSEFSW